MRAAIVEAPGDAPTLKAEAPDPERGQGEALVEVLAAPLNPIDLRIASGGFYLGPPNTPYVPGAEGVGEVLEGDALAAGTRVYFDTAAGYAGDGALAERAVVAEERAIELPDGTDPTLAAAIGVAGLAAWLALEWRAGVSEGENVLVLGASGAVGQVAIQAAKLLGAGTVVAAARDSEGLERARELGADATVDLTAHSGVSALASAFSEAAGGPLDVTIDPLWGEPAAAAAEASGMGARLVNLGESASQQAELTSGTVRGRLLNIIGHTNALAPPEVKRSAYERLVGHLTAGEIELETEEIPLDRLSEAWESQAASPGHKLVLVP